METLETLLIENRFKLLALHTEWQQGPGEFFENLMTTETRDFFLNETVSAFVECYQNFLNILSFYFYCRFMVQFCQLQAALHIIPNNILLDILLEELLN